MVSKLEAAPFRKPLNEQGLPNDLENKILQFHRLEISQTANAVSTRENLQHYKSQ